MFAADGVDEIMEAHGVCASVESLREEWLANVGSTLAEARLAMPAPDAWMQKGGKQGRHTEHMGYLLAEMQFIQRAYPGQQW
jgi:ring-1,2-phenylacetyl-CoA epoxidase subunit PaaC